MKMKLEKILTLTLAIGATLFSSCTPIYPPDLLPSSTTEIENRRDWVSSKIYDAPKTRDIISGLLRGYDSSHE